MWQKNVLIVIEKNKILVTKQHKNLNVPAKLKAPVSKTHSSRVKGCLVKWKIRMFLIRRGTCNNEKWKKTQGYKLAIRYQ